MPNVLIHKASELRPETRAVEAELGRSLQDSEEVSIMAFQTHEAPAGHARAQAERNLQEHLNRIDHATEGVPEQDLEDALNEALRNVRPGYGERE
ncbi:MAG: hypothetical protein ACRD2O_05605 [Terriglobia bacterium]